MNAPHPNEIFELPEGCEKVAIVSDSRNVNTATVKIHLEDHTIGNLVKMQLLRDEKILFAGYRMPHPLEHRIEIKIRTTADHSPSEAYKAAVEALVEEVSLLESMVMLPMEYHEDEEIDTQFALDEIGLLQDHGINMQDIKKMKEAGYHTVSSILMSTRKEICCVKGVSEAKVEKLIEAANKVKIFDFITGNEMLNRRKMVIRVTTGSKELDNLLGGGVETMSITELFGEFRTGKTQICHTLCVTSQLPFEEGGGNGKVAYIDTEGTFRPERIAPIAERFKLDTVSVLDNILCARAYTHEHQIALLPAIAARMAESTFRLLIVDSSTALFRADFSGRGELSERQQKLGRMMNSLMKLAEQFNVAVVLTNQVMSDPSGGAMFVQDPKKPVGGHVMAHASTTRLNLRKGRGEQRVCKIYDSPCLPEAEAIYQISNSGIIDATE